MNLLITGAWHATDEQLEELKACGHSVIRMQDERGEVPCDCAAVEGVICNGLFLYHPLEKFTSLRYIQLTSAGYDRVPMDEVRRRGIAIYNARGVYSVPMAELAIGGVLQLYKQAAYFRGNQSLARWEKHRGLLELAGKTVCILGCGSVGSACAKRFAAFECRVLGVDIQQVHSGWFERVYPLTELDRVLPEADIVVLTLPLTADTRHLMNARRFSLMKRGAVLVNISRGPVVNTRDLLAALDTNLGGAVLDVFEEEPLPENSPLWCRETVVVTPHNSFVGEGNGRRLADVIFSNLAKAE